MQIVNAVLMEAVADAIARGEPCGACGGSWHDDYDLGSLGVGRVLVHTASCCYVRYEDAIDAIERQAERHEDRLMESIR